MNGSSPVADAGAARNGSTSTEPTSTVAIVTGAASGIGRATSIELLALGHIVVGVDLDAAGLEATRSLDGTGRFVPYPGDVSSDRMCGALVAGARELGRLAVIVNSAGIQPPDDSPSTLSIEAWDRVFAVNVRPIFLLARHAAAAMRGAGVIVNLASVHAYSTRPATMSYAASKGAIVALTAQLAVEFAGDGIRVVAVAPGSVDTPMSASSTGPAASGLDFTHSPSAAGRVGQADEVARVIAWLCTDAASFVNGTTIDVDGGLRAILPGSLDRRKVAP